MNSASRCLRLALQKLGTTNKKRAPQRGWHLHLLPTALPRERQVTGPTPTTPTHWVSFIFMFYLLVHVKEGQLFPSPLTSMGKALPQRPCPSPRRRTGQLSSWRAEAATDYGLSSGPRSSAMERGLISFSTLPGPEQGNHLGQTYLLCRPS